MNDTQLRRYEIFVVERADRPPVHAGSVHASDDELALLNARDVFARRPDCLGLWAFRSEMMTSLTSEEPGSSRPAEAPAAPKEPFLVFGKLGPKGVHTFLGVVQAGSAVEAFEEGRRAHGRNVVAWWVVPQRWRLASTADDAGPMFEPSKAKPFRDQAFYPVETMMRQLRRARGSGRGPA